MDKTLKITCKICTSIHYLVVNRSDYIQWQNGQFVQSAFPYLPAGDRELLISRICGSCFTKLFGEVEDCPTNP
jgi:hypothetical protein